MRTIYLPELLKIRIQNFSLYPNGLDYEYSFVKGVNLILGGNGMGKTTFVNIIKYSIIGNYKKPFDYTRTYRGNIIEKRLRYQDGYFKNRMDKRIECEDIASVTIVFKIGDNEFCVKRDLENIILLEFSLNGNPIFGDIQEEFKYEDLSESAKLDTLQFKYEKAIELHSGLKFDDLIFFVNEVLYFGEDHKTILWNDGNSGNDVQNELFNKYFNSPELDNKRQEAQRQAKYNDSLSRHKSEDIRAIRKVLDKIAKQKTGKVNTEEEIVKIKDEINLLNIKLDELQKNREEKEVNISLYQNKLNRLSIEIHELEAEKDKAETFLMRKSWGSLHPLYDRFIKNIKINHVCPICNKNNEKLFEEVSINNDTCFSCKAVLLEIADDDLKSNFIKASETCVALHQEIKKIQSDIKKLEDDNEKLDYKFREISSKKKQLLSKLRRAEYANSKKDQPNDQQYFYDEIDKLGKEKNKYQQLAQKAVKEAEQYSQKIENQIRQSTEKFSSLFSGFARQFLGVSCELTYDKFGEEEKRFYPVIDQQLRRHGEELSESQRFFVDHAFRMSILSFFYSKPTFYIVETPDSSLDISYEQNAANVFLKFLERPNSLIITSNLNNSTFLDHIVDSDTKTKVSIVGLPDIAKKSDIQSVNNSLREIYEAFKNKVMQIL